MKNILFGVLFVLGLNLVVVYFLPHTCFAGFGEDTLGVIKGIDVMGTDKGPSSSLLDTIVRTIRWILGILATVSLAICLYAGFKMLTSGGDSKSYDAGWTILKNAAIGLVIIGLSWIIVSAIFWFVSLQGGDGVMMGGE